MTHSVALCCLLLCALGADAAAPLAVVDHVIPQRVKIEGAEQPALLLGVVRVERKLLPWYTLTLHAGPRIRAAEQLARGHEACRLTLIWQENDVSAQVMHDYFAELFQQTSDFSGQDAMRERIAHFVDGLPPARRGQVWQFDYWPDGGMQIRVDDQLFQHLSGIDMNRAVLGLWLGTEADPAVRAGLFTLP